MRIESSIFELGLHGFGIINEYPFSHRHWGEGGRVGGSELNVNNPAVVSQQARTKAQFSFQNKRALMRIFIPNKTITSIAVYSRRTRKKKNRNTGHHIYWSETSNQTRSNTWKAYWEIRSSNARSKKETRSHMHDQLGLKFRADFDKIFPLAAPPLSDPCQTLVISNIWTCPGEYHELA